MSERKEPHRAAQEEFRRALTGEFEPVRPSEPGTGQAAKPTVGTGTDAAPASAPAASSSSAARRAVAARTERLRAQKARRRRVAIVASAAVVFVVLAATLACAFLNPAEEGLSLEGFFDESAQTGQAPNKTPAELQAELNRIVEEGMFNISIASAIEFASPDATGKAFIENVPGNPYDMTVEITLVDSGEQVYASKGIAPGNYIEDIALSTQLEPGAHEAVATFTAYDRETHAEKGKAAAEVTLLVGKGGDASG